MTPPEAGEPIELGDFDRLIASFNKHGVEFMIVGGYAVIFHGPSRTTKDLDVLIRRTPDNARKAVSALEEIGFECPGFSPELFLSGKGVTFGDPPLRVDVLARIQGIEFDKAWECRERGRFGPNDVSYIGLDDLIANKEAVGRPQDLADVHQLKAVRRKSD